MRTLRYPGLIPANSVCAIQPAMGGKKKVLAWRTRVNLQPRMPTSMGRRLTALMQWIID